MVRKVGSTPRIAAANRAGVRWWLPGSVRVQYDLETLDAGQVQRFEPPSSAFAKFQHQIRIAYTAFRHLATQGFETQDLPVFRVLEEFAIRYFLL